MTELKATIQNEAGIHCRPSALIIKEAATWSGTIEIIAPMGRTTLQSALELIMLGLEKGTTITIRTEGPGEEDFAKKMVELFETHFDFPPK